MTQRNWLTPKAAAVYLEISVSTLARYRSRGGGPIWYRRGGRILYDRPALDAWIEPGVTTNGGRR